MSDYNSSMPVRTESAGDIAAKIVDATTPSQGLAIDASGHLGAKLFDGAGTALTSQASGGQQALDVGINVAGVQIDPRAVRALTSADVVTAAQGAKNASNAQAWWTRLTDGTNDSVLLATGELTVSVTQPLPAGTNLIGSVHSRAQDGAGTDITSTLVNSKQRLDTNLASEGTDGSTAPFGTVQVGGKDGSGNLQALSTDTNGQLKTNIFDSTGAAITGANPLPVQVAAGVPGTEVHNYNTASAIAANASSNHDYTITATKTFKGEKFWASASGKLKIEVQTSTDGTTFTTKWVGFNSASAPNIDVFLGQFTVSDSGTGSKIRIIRTNLDKAAMDVYSTISGVEI